VPTGGKLFAAGIAGERFAVRNSGAIAVVEDMGDHGCEYITGEVVVAVGATGLNFGSGMTSVFALMLDQDNKFVDRYNRELIDIHRIDSENMEAHCNYLHELLTEYVAETESDWGRHFGRLFQLRAPLLADQADRLGARIADRQPAPGPGGLIANKRGV